MRNAISIGFLIWFSLVFSQPRNQVFVGARPLALGETFTAIADDGNTVLWNPAGLPLIRRYELNSMHANMYGIPSLKNNFVSFVYPLSYRFAVGLSWFDYGYDDDELTYSRSKIQLSLGGQVYKNIMLGATIKYFSMAAQSEGVLGGSAGGFGADIGFLYPIVFAPHRSIRKVQLGIGIHDVGGTRVMFRKTEAYEKILAQNIRFGVGLYLAETWDLLSLTLNNPIIALDLSDRIHLGMETWLSNLVALRIGIQKDRGVGQFPRNEGLTASFGSGLKIPKLPVQFEYAFVVPPTLPPTHIFSLSIIPSGSPIKIKELVVQDVYASLAKSYAQSGIGYAIVSNEQDHEAKISMFCHVKDLSNPKVKQVITLAPREQKRIDLLVNYYKNILAIRDRQSRQLEVKLEYQLNGESKTVVEAKPFNLYGRGAINWSIPERVVSFVTKMDPIIQNFAKRAISGLPYRNATELGNIYIAAAVFEALRSVGVQYSNDPNRPFVLKELDSIQYPGETLTNAKKGGECDDLSVLYASLLEFLGIKIAFVVSRQHIFVLFDSGIHKQNWPLIGSLGFFRKNERDKSCWIPVEVTEIDQPFYAAWLMGVNQYLSVKDSSDTRIVNFAENESRYESNLPDDILQPAPSVNAVDWQKKFHLDDVWLKTDKVRYLTFQYEKMLQKNPDNHTARNKLAIILAFHDSLQSAEQHLNAILKREPNHLQAMQNLANIYTISARFEAAQRLYFRLEKVTPRKPGFWLNWSLLYQLWKIDQPTDSTRQQELSELLLANTFKLLNSNETDVLDLVGIQDEDLDWQLKAGIDDWIKAQAAALKQFISDNLQRHISNKRVPGAKLKRNAIKRGIDQDRRYILWWAE